MKKLLLLVLLSMVAITIFAADVTLRDGRVYKGDIISSQENRVIIQEDGVVTQIPAEKISTVLDNGENVTDKIIEQAKLGQATDIHFIEDDDFFVSENSINDSPFIQVKTAKMINPPTKVNKMQGQFMLTGDGSQITTGNYYSTKVGKLESLKTDQTVICFEGKNDDGIYRGPQTDEDKRNGTWIMSKVKDLSQAQNGYVVLSNGYKVSLDNIRIIVKP